MRRLVIFLGLFSLLALGLTAVAGVLVEHDLVRSSFFADVAWGASAPLLAYLVLSLRALAKK
jgi:hypothetical protein